MAQWRIRRRRRWKPRCVWASAPPAGHSSHQTPGKNVSKIFFLPVEAELARSLRHFSFWGTFSQRCVIFTTTGAQPPSGHTYETKSLALNRLGCGALKTHCGESVRQSHAAARRLIIFPSLWRRSLRDSITLLFAHLSTHSNPGLLSSSAVEKTHAHTRTHTNPLQYLKCFTCSSPAH